MTTKLLALTASLFGCAAPSVEEPIAVNRSGFPPFAEWPHLRGVSPDGAEPANGNRRTSFCQSAHPTSRPSNPPQILLSFFPYFL